MHKNWEWRKIHLPVNFEEPVMLQKLNTGAIYILRRDKGQRPLYIINCHKLVS